uniref:MGAT4 conserved region domain-containing protein n=1 Tax=Bubo bubo TaxID=30461 RepID=A0A8C0EG51_BUBBB
MRVAANIAHKFAHHILLGRLLLIHAPHEFYPTLKGLKRNYNDPEERVRFRSKQNLFAAPSLWLAGENLTVVHPRSPLTLLTPTLCLAEFLAVGLASVRRPRGYYLPATLQSLFKQSTEEELQEMVVVVHLADADPRWNMRVAANIAHKFAHHILLGRLLLIHAPHEFYPTLKGLKRNYNDPEERVRFRSKQNVDYAFLLAFAANLSSYYLMIEDDVWCAKSFLTAIRKALASQEGSNWATLEFSKLGYIGKLYRSSDLPRLARFLLLFYQEMPCDWLLVHFRLLLTQKDVIRFKPSLFQHMGLYSSFQGTVNRLEDDEFQADALDLPDNPPAALFTSMSVFENYEPLKAYSTAEGYFWGKDPAAGSVFSIVFQQPARVTRVRVRTGSDGGTPGPVECVRIRVTRDQSEWLIIQSIDIWTAAGT